MRLNLFLIMHLSFYASMLLAQEQPAYVETEMKRAAARMQSHDISYVYPYDWIYQRLELTLDPRNQYVSGNTVIYFRPENEMLRLELDLSNALNVLQVDWHGQNPTHSHSGNRLSISFPSPLPAGQIDSVVVVYEGVPPGAGFGAFATDEHDYVPILWTLSEPYGAKEWWPCKDQLPDKLDSVDVILHYPAVIGGETMQGVSNGVLVSEDVSGNQKTSRWRHRHKILAYLVAVAITNYVQIEQQAGIYRSFPVKHYVYPEDSIEASMFLPVTSDLMNFYEQKYGEYRFSDEKYGHAEFEWGGGMEHTTITFIGGFSRGLIAHELAHQWFGDDVTCGSWSDIWLNEGFATYSEALTQEAFDGEDAFKSWRRYANRLIIREPHHSLYVYDDDTLDVDRLFSWRTTYLKGAMVLHMIRRRAGDSLFFESLRAYRQKFRENAAMTDDFLQVLDSVSGMDFTEFFDDWVYGKGYPSYQVSRRFVSGTVWEITIDQAQSDSSVEFFEMPLTLRFYGTNGQTFDTIVNHTSDGQRFYIDPGFTSDSVALDPDDHVIKGPTEYLHAGSVQWTSEMMVFPNPAHDGFWCFVKDYQPGDKIFLYDISGKLLVRSRPNRYIFIRNLAKGVYVLHIVRDGKTISMHKILVN